MMHLYLCKIYPLYCFCAPPPYTHTLKLHFHVGDVDLPDIRKSSAVRVVEEEESAQSCPCDNAGESRTHIVRECEWYKEFFVR